MPLAHNPTALLIALACLLSAACQREIGPREAFEEFVQAASAADGEAAWPFLTDEAQQALKARADAANAGAKAATVRPHDVLTSAGLLDPLHILQIEQADSEDDDSATLTVKTVDKREHTVKMIRQSDTWRVVIPLPPAGS